MFDINNGDSPEEVFNYWDNTAAHLQDEINRIRGLLRERHPFTKRPVHFGNSPFHKGCFEIKLPRHADQNFVDQLLNYYRRLDWTATVKNGTDIGGGYKMLLLQHHLCDFSQQDRTDNN